MVRKTPAAHARAGSWQRAYRKTCRYQGFDPTVRPPWPSDALASLLPGSVERPVPGPRLMRICMVSSLHPADDIRIVEKEARSLAAAGHNVTVVARPPAPKDRGNIEFKLIDVATPAGRNRRWAMARAALALARSLRPEVVQFHDPELILLALIMRSQMCKVVYDVHEDVPADIRSKAWIPAVLRPGVSALAGFIERLTARHFDA